MKSTCVSVAFFVVCCKFDVILAISFWFAVIVLGDAIVVVFFSFDLCEASCCRCFSNSSSDCNFYFFVCRLYLETINIVSFQRISSSESVVDIDIHCATRL